MIMTGDWGGGRTWLKDHGITVSPRVTMFYQGMTSGDDGHRFESGAKADILLNAVPAGGLYGDHIFRPADDNRCSTLSGGDYE